MDDSGHFWMLALLTSLALTNLSAVWVALTGRRRTAPTGRRMISPQLQ
jgi:hypothetical protein